MNSIVKLLLAVVVLMSLADSVSAGTVGFKFSFVTSTAARNALGLATSTAGASGPNLTGADASGNTPYVLVENTGTASGVTLSSFSFTLGAGRFFDFAIRESGYGNLTWTQVSPGTPDNNENGTAGQAPFSPTLSYSFGGFEGGERFSAQVDVDSGSMSLSQLLAAISGKIVTATYSNEQVLTGSYAATPAASPANVYSVSNSAVAIVPLPSAAWAGLALLSAVGSMQARRNTMLKA